MRAQSAARRPAFDGSRHRSLVVLATFVKERVQNQVRVSLAAGLGVNHRIRGIAADVARRDVFGREEGHLVGGRPRERRRCGKWRGSHSSSPVTRPSVAGGEWSDHAMLGSFRPADAPAPAPPRNASIAGVGDRKPGLFVAPEFSEPPLIVQAVERVRHRAVPHQQDRAERGESRPELGEAVLDEGKVPGRPLRRCQHFRLVDIQTDHRSAFCGFDQGCMIRDPQVALEPDDGSWHPIRFATGVSTDSASFSAKRVERP